jgi:hypothetical protein
MLFIFLSLETPVIAARLTGRGKQGGVYRFPVNKIWIYRCKSCSLLSKGGWWGCCVAGFNEIGIIVLFTSSFAWL